MRWGFALCRRAWVLGQWPSPLSWKKDNMKNEGWVQPSSGGGGTGSEFQSRPWEREQRGREMAAPGGQSVPRALGVHSGPPRGKLRDRKGLCLRRTAGPGSCPLRDVPSPGGGSQPAQRQDQEPGNVQSLCCRGCPANRLRREGTVRMEQ